MNTLWFTVRVPHGEDRIFNLCVSMHPFVLMVMPRSWGQDSEIYSFHCCKTIDCDLTGHSTVHFDSSFSEKPSASVFNVAASPAFSKTLVKFARKPGVIMQLLTT
jgi:hypothetical protein